MGLKSSKSVPREQVQANIPNLIYKDNDFKTQNNIINLSTYWKRAADIVKDPKFVVADFNHEDLYQGQIGSCWILAALKALINNEVLFYNLLFINSFNKKFYCGRFLFKLYEAGEEKIVTVDDQLPTDKNGNLLFCQNRKDKNEMWPALFEKAVCKHLGDYAKIDGGSFETAIKILLPNFNSNNCFTKTLKYITAESLKKLFLNLIATRSIIITYRYNEKENDSKSFNDIVYNHAYAILDYYEGRVQIHNPWGTKEPKNSMFKKYSEDVHDLNDGTWWITVEEFKKLFTHIEYYTVSGMLKFKFDYPISYINLDHFEVKRGEDFFFNIPDKLEAKFESDEILTVLEFRCETNEKLKIQVEMNMEYRNKTKETKKGVFSDLKILSIDPEVAKILFIFSVLVENNKQSAHQIKSKCMIFNLTKKNETTCE